MLEVGETEERASEADRAEADVVAAGETAPAVGGELVTGWLCSTDVGENEKVEAVAVVGATDMTVAVTGAPGDESWAG